MLSKIKNFFKKEPDLTQTAESMKNNPEPWVNVVKAHVDPSNPKQGYFELEWNTAFVLFLRNNGYVGNTPEEIVDKWFTDLCRNVGQDGDNDGNFIADAGRMMTSEKTRVQR
jgi:hypothetical protein